MSRPARTALEILAKAEFDPIIAEELFEDALGGYWEEGIEKIKDELNVGDGEAELVWEHIRSVACGRALEFKEVTADEVEFTSLAQRSGPGNPFVLGTIGVELVRGTRATGSLFALVARNRRRYGGYIVHAAIVLLAIGIAGSSAYGSSTERRLVPGQSMAVRGYTLTYRGISHPFNQNAVETRAVFDVSGRYNGQVLSGDNQYRNPPEPSREVGIKTDWLRAQDLYVIADDINTKTNVVYVKVLVKPLVTRLAPARA